MNDLTKLLNTYLVRKNAIEVVDTLQSYHRGTYNVVHYDTYYTVAVSVDNQNAYLPLRIDNKDIIVIQYNRMLVRMSEKLERELFSIEF